MDEMVAEVQQWLNDTYSFDVLVDGITGTETFTALIKALQTEIGVTVDGSFGSATLSACPTLQEVEDTDTAEPSNLTYILQGSFWCKGYNPVGFTGIFGSNTTSAVKNFQADAGIDEDGIVTPYILQGIMNTDGYTFSDTDDLESVYKHNVQLGLNKYYGTEIGLIAPNGEWERKSHRNLIKACQLEWGTSVDGVWGSGTMSCAPTLSINTSGYTNSKRLLQWSLVVNGYYPDNLDGTFSSSTKEAVTGFQELMELDADGIAGKNTWASLLVSYGNTSRTATACDTSTRLTSTYAENLISAGYEDVGRYLTNVENSTLDKKMTDDELQIIENAGLRVFPIFQTYGGEASYFTRYQGQKDAYIAKYAARDFGFPSKTTIYFAVDYDALMADISSNIIPYFRGICEIIGTNFRVGAYAPRAVCKSLISYGLIKYSFVADMSSSFTGNIGVAIPSNWAYDQILETSTGGFGIDKCIASSRSTAISPSELISYDDTLTEAEIEEIINPFKLIYDLAYEYLDSLSTPLTGIYASVFNANEMTLQYLRSSSYDYSSDEEYDISNYTEIIDLNGALWATIAGARDSGFIELAEESCSSVVPESLKLVNPDDQFEFGVPHFAATLNACISGTLSLYIDSLERNVDAFAGWAGDLMQLAAMLERSKNKGYNYFNENDLFVIIGAESETLDSYHFFKEDDSDEETDDPGFGIEDLYQDIDAYNIARIYDLSDIKIYEAINDYYFVSAKYKNRYSIFASELIAEFDADSLYDVIYGFTSEDKGVLSDIFSFAFGDFSADEYGEVLAQAFSDKIYLLASLEK